MAHAPLVTRAELVLYGVAPDFLAQFNIRPLEVLVEAGGELGTAAFAWRTLGEENWSAPEKSDPGAPWEWAPPGAFAALSFGAAEYLEGHTFLVDKAGNVSTTVDAVGLTASRIDRVAAEIDSATAMAIDLMRPRTGTTLVEWGAGVKKAVTMIVRWGLKDGVGLAPTDSAVGDGAIKEAYLAALEYLSAIGRGDRRPADLDDGSADREGQGLMVRAAGADSRGF